MKKVWRLSRKKIFYVEIKNKNAENGAETRTWLGVMCMMNIPWYVVMLRAIPEVIGLILLCLAIINENIENKSFLKVSIITILTTFTIKMLPIRFGINTLFLIILDSIYLNVFLDINMWKAITGFIASLTILSLSEWLTVIIAVKILGIPMDMIFSNSLYYTLFGIPSLLALYLLAFLKFRYNLKNSYKRAG